MKKIKNAFAQRNAKKNAKKVKRKTVSVKIVSLQNQIIAKNKITL